jgi:hypothetical protein
MWLMWQMRLTALSSNPSRIEKEGVSEKVGPFLSGELGNCSIAPYICHQYEYSFKKKKLKKSNFFKKKVDRSSFFFFFKLIKILSASNADAELDLKVNDV